MKEYWLVEVFKKHDDSNGYRRDIYYYSMYLGRFDTERIAMYAMKDFIRAIQDGKVKDSENILDIEIVKGPLI